MKPQIDTLPLLPRGWLPHLFIKLTKEKKKFLNLSNVGVAIKKRDASGKVRVPCA